MDFYEAWRFLCEHKIFKIDRINSFDFLLNIGVVRVNPDILEIGDDREKNTLTQVWLETGPWVKPEELSEAERQVMPNGVASHDIDLDCGAGTFEEAIVKLAELVKKKYGQA